MIFFLTFCISRLKYGQVLLWETYRSHCSSMNQLILNFKVLQLAGSGYITAFK